MSETIERVAAFVESCIAGETAGDREFDRLAREVFAYQYERVPLYRRLCDLRGVDPSRLAHWTEIPHAPADLFKEEGLLVACGQPAARFLSSGTTAGATRRSRHELGTASLALYERSALAHFRAMVLPDAPGPLATLVVGPTAETHPHSSLGHMYSWIARDFADGAAFVAFDREGRLDEDAALAWLEAAAASTTPVLILALASTVTALFARLRRERRELRLPADSRLVETGGSKGGKAYSKAGLLKAAWRFLHIPAYLCTSEYGMTELLSQFYDDALLRRWRGTLGPRAMVGPPWVRSAVVDPTTLEPASGGRRGILRHFDLANCESVAAVQTLDVGRACGEGFEVLGRAAGAEARGCSHLLSMLTTDGTR